MNTLLRQTDSLKVKFQKFEKLKKQELARWWDGITLQKYLDNKKIPRGLRILIFPTYEDLDDEALKDWEDNLQNASFNMMRILIKHIDKKVAKLQDDIETLEREIDGVSQKDLINKNYEILHKIVEDYQIYLRDKKLRKVKRDDLDYKLGRIYTFARKYDNVKISGSRTNSDRFTNDTDLSSGGSMSSIDSSTLQDSEPSKQVPHSSANSFLVEMERLRLGTKTNRREIRPEGVGNNGEKSLGKQGVRTRSKKD
ncbi:hypothetical protein NDU88_005340 [Pleurodeles waltl]|uniref:Uncharacterized protein n=1 Tax=Pleurodeles waltl TaxID=8319 RepID=A0AAV7WY92_PLEWA|nr:hypothetical protein NDU88_005340 [Pleurodeles waltl]